MISETWIFNVSGPSYITCVDWNCASYRRTVMASIVQGVYTLEHDRQKKLLGHRSLASPWWEFFHFKLHKVLVDSADSSIFGAILELKLPSTLPKGYSLNAPKYVIAFRGTLTGSKTRSRDLHLDLKIMINTLHTSSRFKVAMHSIEETVDSVGAASVWLAGHSLGSAIALLAGKNMAKMGYALPTYLFNSPFTSAALERINHHKIMQKIHIYSSVIKAGLSAALEDHHHQPSDEQNDSFAVLSKWVPHMLVNRGDHISSAYISYFAQREKMEITGAAKIENIATKCTAMSLLLSATLDGISEPFHLLPSAELTVNMHESPSFSEAHGIRQWWAPHSQFQSSVYLYK